MSENRFGGFTKALSNFVQDPTFKRESVKMGFRVAGGALMGIGGLWVWNRKRKADKKDKEEEEQRKRVIREQEREAELNKPRP